MGTGPGLALSNELIAFEPKSRKFAALPRCQIPFSGLVWSFFRTFFSTRIRRKKLRILLRFVENAPFVGDAFAVPPSRLTDNK